MCVSQQELPFPDFQNQPLKMNDQVYTVCVSSGVLYGCKPWAIKYNHDMGERVDMGMVRGMCGILLSDRQPMDLIASQW